MNYPAIRMKTTRYGLSPSARGWDKPGDSGTDQYRGFGIPDAGFATLNRSACALTVSAEDALVRTLDISDEKRSGGPLRLPISTLLYVRYEDPKFNRVCVLLDRAPENDMRLDIFLPFHDDPTIPDHGLVSVLLLGDNPLLGAQS